MVNTMLSEQLKLIANQFNIIGEVVSVVNYGDGHINRTYKVNCISKDEVHNYILQKVNSSVFKEPELLMNNIVKVTEYLNQILLDEDLDDYEVLTVVQTHDGNPYYISDDQELWRVYVFVEDSIGYTYTDSLEILREGGKAIGMFQKLLVDFPAQSLHETIKDFHNTNVRYEQLNRAYSENKAERNQNAIKEIAFCGEVEQYAGLIINGLDKGDIPYRVTHNDTKLNNVLMDIHKVKGKCVIDLDTVMSGSSLFDFGDAIRSCGSAANEDEKDLEKVYLDLNRFDAFTGGYLNELGDSLCENEIAMLVDACIIMTLECGIRFLADYLNGDIYFRIHHPEHNLDRAKNQFKLVKDMLEKTDEMNEIIKGYLE